MAVDFVECQVCRQKMSLIAEMHLRKHGLTTSEYRNQYPEANLITNEVREKVRQASIKMWENPNRKLANTQFWENEERANEVKAKRSKALKGRKYTELFSPEEVERLRALRRKSKFWNIPFKERSALSRKVRQEMTQRLQNDKVYRQRYSAMMSAAIKKAWRKPKFIKAHTRKISPNKAEKALQELLNELFPNIFGYNGNYHLGISLGGRIPDFVNLDGKKQVIELFGDYWHRGDNPQSKIKHYQKFGFDCLVIWEKELKDKEQLAKKLLSFGGKKFR